jgi:hypothetical protein
MVKEDTIVTVINVSRKDDQQYFQVVLPRDTVSIKGFESGAVLKTNMPVNTESFLGNLQLQAEGQSNYCYCTDIFLDRPNAQVQALGFTNQLWIKKAFEQSGNREPEPVDIQKCHVLYGCYKDTLGKKLNTDLNYNVNIYIWIDRV